MSFSSSLTYLRRYPLMTIFWVAVLLRVPSWFVPYYNVDEITNGLFSNFVLDGKIDLEFFLGNTYLLTHYFYNAVFSIFGPFNLRAIHIVNSVWVGLTALALYSAAVSYTENRRTGYWASGLYAVFSIAFLSKDFHAALSESFSLLPAALSASAYFYALRKERDALFIVAGFLAALSVLFKFTTAGICVGFGLGLFCLGRRAIVPLFYFCFSFFVGFTLPIFIYGLLHGNFLEAVQAFFFRFNRTATGYVGFYTDLPSSYIILKYLFRSFLVALSLLGLTIPALYAIIRLVQSYRSLFSRERAAVIALLGWLIVDWLMVFMGKRVFFHYFVTLLAPLAILAGLASQQVEAFIRSVFVPFASRRRMMTRALLVLVCLPVLVFFFDGIFRFGGTRPDVDHVAAYVRAHTKPSDSIFVWGFSPHLYYEARRQPASVFFWSDALAGTSPGSGAMEYAAATQQKIDVVSGFMLDLKKPEPSPVEARPLPRSSITLFEENELFDFMDILEIEPFPEWRQVFFDFFISPPELIIDSSADDFRHFKKFPLKKYELLRRFVESHYIYETTIDHAVIYRRKTE